MKDLNEIRNQINEIDKQMAELFEQRMNLAKDVAEHKKKYALSIEDKAREKQVIENNLVYIKNPQIKEYYVTFMHETMGVSKQYQACLMNGMQVAYSGVEGAFAHIASKSIFPTSQLLSCANFEEAYTSVEKGICDACVLPLENSYAGDVGSVMDLVFSGSLYINKVIDVEILHNLIVKKGTKLSDIKTVISHPQAIAQCQKFIESHGFKVVEHTNTAIAAKELALSNKNDVAVIASSDVAKIYDLEIIVKNINESRNNTTRFAVFSRALHAEANTDKSKQHFILVFTVKNEAGALAKTLNIIGYHNFNMRTLRSRPMKELQWNYYFFIEADGDINSSDGVEMIKQLQTVCDRLKVVGSYSSQAER